MLRNIILVVKDLKKTRKFFEEVVRVPVKFQSETSMELVTGSCPIIIKESYNVAQIQTGYSPILSFDVENLDETVTLALSQGAMMDGSLKYPAHGKFAALRTPDGHILGLYEPVVTSPSVSPSSSNPNPNPIP